MSPSDPVSDRESRDRDLFLDDLTIMLNCAHIIDEVTDRSVGVWTDKVREAIARIVQRTK